mmetsp:Transcript_12732/g.25839  ORF Transcript_12732/g.25839 Transcript_12732/m.25839 type:complete len:83 (-) Transcript_12732:1433-1681(-)
MRGGNILIPSGALVLRRPDEGQPIFGLGQLSHDVPMRNHENLRTSQRLAFHLLGIINQCNRFDERIHDKSGFSNICRKETRQ